MPIDDHRRHGLRFLEQFGLFSSGKRRLAHGKRRRPFDGQLFGGERPHRSLVTPPPRDVPVFDPALGHLVLPTAIDNPWHVRLKVGLTCLAATAIGASAFMLLPHDKAPAPVAADLAVSPPVTLPPIPEPSSAVPVTISSMPSPPASSTRPTPSTPAAQPHPSPSTTRPPTKAPPTPQPRLRVGERVSLVESARPRYRIRHHDFLGRVDRIGADSSAADRADATFVVRSGASGGCVAFESVNYPGRFLRHRNFVIHLDRQDGSTLFAQDSTFCPVSTRSGLFVLRSVNYPSRFVTERDSALLLTSPATEFRVVAPS